MDNSKVNQTELSYNSAVGDIKVNVCTGRMLLILQDFTIGLESYGLTLSHIYNSHLSIPGETNNYIGDKWKLNLQQYVYYCDEKYYYVDGTGMTLEFKLLTTNVYYDVNGFGMKLNIYSDRIEISDMSDNIMVFKNNKLVETRSSENISIVKKYVYQDDKLFCIYDERTPHTKISFQYNTNELLEDVVAIVKNKEQFRLKYYYEDGYLKSINKVVNGYEKEYIQFKYKEFLLEYAALVDNGYGARFVYNDNKISEVNLGVTNFNVVKKEKMDLYLNDDVYPGETSYIGDKTYFSSFLLEDGIDEFGTNLLTYNHIIYAKEYTIVQNEKDIKMIYYLNEQGYTVSILESLDDENTDLRALKKMPGESMLNDDVGNDNEKINKQKSLLITMDTIISTNIDSVMSGKLEKIAKYRGDTYKHYQNYTCSFWLKLLDNVTNSKVKIIVESEDGTNSGKTSFDTSAINSWQEVRIPIMISSNNIKSVSIEFLERDESKKIKIADMKLYYSFTNKTIVTNGVIDTSLDNVKKIQYIPYFSTEYIDMILDEDKFITEKDLQLTYLSKFKLYGNNNNDNEFQMFYNDGTESLLVKKVILYVDSILQYYIEFANDDYTKKIGIENTRALYLNESKSPDGNLTIQQIPHFIKRYEIDGNIYDCMYNITEGNLYQKEDDDGNSVELHRDSYTIKCLDLKGKTLLERDEYGVLNIYKYDENGIMSQKVITNEIDINDRMVVDMKTAYNTDLTSNDYAKNTINDELITNNMYYNNKGNIYKIEKFGTNGQNNNGLIQEYKYNLFNNQVKSIINKIEGTDKTGGLNNVQYDNYGRIIEVSPKRYDDAYYYGYKFKYDNFGEPIEFLYSHKENHQKIDNLLVEKEINRVNNQIVTKYYRNINDPDIVDMRLDKYGDISEINIDDKCVTYHSQTLFESPGAANINEIIDGLDGNKYSYEYDDFNNLTKYGYTNDDVTVTLYKNKNNVIRCEETYTDATLKITNSFSTIVPDESKIFSPRITETMHQITSGHYGTPTKYYYDNFGRINQKEIDLYNYALESYHMSNLINYVPKTNLVDSETIKFTYSSEVNLEYKFEYDYDELGCLKTNNILVNNGEKVYNHTYIYNLEEQLEEEYSSYYNSTRQYEYNDDGSIKVVIINGAPRYYHYNNKGQLSLITESGSDKWAISYDNLGNVTQFGSSIYTWERGKLLNSYTNDELTTTYHYNGFGKKYKKVLPDGTIIKYNYDGDKLLSEYWSTGRQIKYIYDLTGISGLLFSERNYDLPQLYTFVKDIYGNVVSIVHQNEEIVHYEYDAFGNCYVIGVSDDIIANLNPIRWKSLYFEIESNLYFLEGNTYSPTLRQNLSMKFVDEVLDSINEIYNLYPYQLCSTNTINIIIKEHNIESSLALNYDPKGKPKWIWVLEKFWRSDLGKQFAIALTIVATLIAFSSGGWLGLILLLAPVGATLVVGAYSAGQMSKKTGKGFWNGFGNYINENWSQVLGTEMGIYILAFGLSKITKWLTDCFIAGTLVLTSIGLIKIEDIKVNDEVWSYNEKTQKKELKKVKRIFRNKTKQWLHLYIKNEKTNKEEKIICTPSHRIYIKDKGWILANKIVENDKVLLYNDVEGIVLRKEIQKLDSYETTYNFEVEDNHNYYVGQENVLVHNKCAEEYLKEALERKGLNKVPNEGLNETWMEGNYKITVRVHAGNSQYTDAKMIYRVSRQKIGFGVEYLGANSKWYHQSVLKPQNIGYDDFAAQITHIKLY